MTLVSCRSGGALASKVVSRYRELSRETGTEGDIRYLEDVDFQFSDGESCVRLDADVNGHDVFIFQALYDPGSGGDVDRNYLTFMMAARACREWGASHVTGVLPYLAYARQDKPTKFEREPTTAELMADLSIEAGIERLVVWNPHTDGIHGFYGSVPVVALSPLAFFKEEFERFGGRDDVIAVAPDGGASKLIMHFARALGISSAVASKYRPRPEQAEVSEIMGDFRGKRIAIVLDDMINTGGTMEATVTKLVEGKGIESVHLGVSHNLCTERAYERLSDLQVRHHLEGAVVTNSVPQAPAFEALPFLAVRSLEDPLARTVHRIHHNRSMNGVSLVPTVQEG